MQQMERKGWLLLLLLLPLCFSVSLCTVTRCMKIGRFKDIYTYTHTHIRRRVNKSLTLFHFFSCFVGFVAFTSSSLAHRASFDWDGIYE